MYPRGLPNLIAKIIAAIASSKVAGKRRDSSSDTGRRVKTFLTNYVQIKVTDLGVEKVKGIRATDEQVARLVAKAEEILARS